MDNSSARQRPHIITQTKNAMPATGTASNHRQFMVEFPVTPWESASVDGLAFPFHRGGVAAAVPS